MRASAISSRRSRCSRWASEAGCAWWRGLLPPAREGWQRALIGVLGRAARAVCVCVWWLAAAAQGTGNGLCTRRPPASRAGDDTNHGISGAAPALLAGTQMTTFLVRTVSDGVKPALAVHPYPHSQPAMCICCWVCARPFVAAAARAAPALHHTGGMAGDAPETSIWLSHGSRAPVDHDCLQPGSRWLLVEPP